MNASTMRRAFELARPIRHCNSATFFRQSCSKHPVSSITSKRLDTTRNGAQTRPFTSSTAYRATVAIHNPRTDEEGNPMNIIISDRAAKRLKQIVSAPPKKNTLTSASAEDNVDSHLRVTVTAGGCHGFQYLMSLEGKDKIDQEEDTIFEFEDSTTADQENAKAEVVLDQASLELLKGSTVDFTTELIGSQFTIVGNPRATSSCGCGTSFDIE